MNSINYYNKHTDHYIQDTFSIHLGTLHTMFLAYIPIGGKILDAGCGPGRDAKLYSEMGYDVTAMDGSEAMIAHCRQWLDEKAVCATFESFHTEEKYDGIWASASFLHVEEKDMPVTITKFLGFLKPSGIFYLSYKVGDHSYEKDGRHYTCYTNESLKALMDSIPSVIVLELTTTSDERAGRSNELWLNLIIRHQIA
ncbi:MAG: class I SAM-dependent methyltransferase [Vallitaleaceae bacterium]|jgi:2-polyprenyl-3-methyl-5-hydroxy-6-metoxy-1,4-benzoquinol methylase|nr:class I SAM-dependent methyltransferase [Vallitaleaceae bacterium]